MTGNNEASSYLRYFFGGRGHRISIKFDDPAKLSTPLVRRLSDRYEGVVVYIPMSRRRIFDTYEGVVIDSPTSMEFHLTSVGIAYSALMKEWSSIVRWVWSPI